MHRRRLPIHDPCAADWSAMWLVDDATRHCEQCRHEVHDLSAMTQARAKALLHASAGARVCVRYRSGHDGQIRFADPNTRRPNLAWTVLAAAASLVALIGCSGHQIPTLTVDEDQDRAVLELWRVSAVALAEPARARPLVETPLVEPPCVPIVADPTTDEDPAEGTPMHTFPKFEAAVRQGFTTVVDVAPPPTISTGGISLGMTGGSWDEPVEWEASKAERRRDRRQSRRARRRSRHSGRSRHE